MGKTKEVTGQTYTDLWRELGDKYNFHLGSSCPLDPEMKDYHNCSPSYAMVRPGGNGCFSIFFEQRERLLKPLGIPISDDNECFVRWEAIAFAKMRHKIGKLSDEELADFERIVVEMSRVSKQLECMRREKEKKKADYKDMLRNL